MPPTHAENRIVKIGKADDCRHHHARIGQRLCRCLPQRFISPAELFEILILVVKNLFHLLASHHFFHKAVDASQMLLLGQIVFFTPLSVKLDEKEHQQQKADDNQGKPEIQDNQHGNGARYHDKALYQKGKAVIQRLGQGIHIIGEPAHQLAVSMRVEIGKRKVLGMFKQIPSDASHDFLAGVNHQLIVAQRGQRPGSRT